MKGAEIKLGYAPTRRSIFSAPDAIEYRGLTKERLLELGVSFVDIDGINPEGLLYDDKDVAPILEKFRKEQLENIAALKVLCAAWRTSTAAMPWPSSAGTPCKGSWASCPARPTPS